MHLVHDILNGSRVLGMLAVPVLFLVSAFAGDEAAYYYNIYQRQKNLPELPMGFFSRRDSLLSLWFCSLPDDMSPLVRGFVWRYRLWIALFFGDLLFLMATSFLL